jgi:hypothetical protein
MPNTLSPSATPSLPASPLLPRRRTGQPPCHDGYSFRGKCEKSDLNSLILWEDFPLSFRAFLIFSLLPIVAGTRAINSFITSHATLFNLAHIHKCTSIWGGVFVFLSIRGKNGIPVEATCSNLSILLFPFSKQESGVSGFKLPLKFYLLNLPHSGMLVAGSG